jgi:hypothetical protein
MGKCHGKSYFWLHSSCMIKRHRAQLMIHMTVSHDATLVILSCRLTFAEIWASLIRQTGTHTKKGNGGRSTGGFDKMRTLHMHSALCTRFIRNNRHAQLITHAPNVTLAAPTATHEDTGPRVGNNWRGSMRVEEHWGGGDDIFAAIVVLFSADGGAERGGGICSAFRPRKRSGYLAQHFGMRACVAHCW